MIARNPSTEGEPELVKPYADQREREKLKKRRQRARRYDAGLKADGTPVTRLAWSMRKRAFWEPKHPSDCVCYDCLFPKG